MIGWVTPNNPQSSIRENLKDLYQAYFVKIARLLNRINTTYDGCSMARRFVIVVFGFGMACSVGDDGKQFP